MVRRIEVALKTEFDDSKARNLLDRLKVDFKLDSLSDLRRVHVYTYEDNLDLADAKILAKEVFTDPVNQIYSLDAPLFSNFSVAVEVGYRPGVKDNVGDTAKMATADAIVKKLKGKVFTSTLYVFLGEITLNDAQKIAKTLCNTLIEQYKILTPSDLSNYYKNPYYPKAGEKTQPKVEIISLDISDAKLKKLSKDRLLALNLNELNAIKNYYNKEKVKKSRKKIGISEDPTDVELECLAQTWSEHCKHKIFNAKIHYSDHTYYNPKTKEKKIKKMTINSLFKTYISGTTKKIDSAKKYLVSLFVDNAGVMAINSKWGLALKAETHNTPSALDPFGGALTGILGVNRDVIGTGLGAKPIFNTDIFCFADPNYDKQIPPILLHPKRVFQGVHAGVAKGGNASGIPTVNGSVVFDDRYLGKPLVYCGTGGLMPLKLKDGRESHIKNIQKGDLIFAVGGRVGKDGIHGATFSSEELTEDSPTSAVQLGDPFTQKIVMDFLLESRNQGLHNGLQDMGAGGLSSAVGELAEVTNGALINLEKSLLKYPGLNPWEIFVSESQERMVACVPKENAQKFVSLAKTFEVEITNLGEFTDTGYLQVNYDSKPVLYIDVKFLHHGLPTLDLCAVWDPKEISENLLPEPKDLSKEIINLLKRPNITSKESIVRQYDHEVQGMSVIKPFCGEKRNGPSDAGVLQPFADESLGIVVSHGICPRYSDLDCYNMAQLAVDEAVRNYIATGGDPHHWAGLDNFCWPDPVKSDSTPDGEYKLAQLVRANQGMAEACIAYQLPLISGKDSMKNDYSHSNVKISVPPTLLISLAGTMKDVSKSISTNFKQAGDLIYILGKTYDEMGGSEYYAMHNKLGKTVPSVNLKDNHLLYKRIHICIKKGLLNSAHDSSDGGIAIALAESAIGGQFGFRLRIKDIDAEPGMRDDHILFSESAGRFIVTVSPKNKSKFQEAMHSSSYSLVGMVTNDSAIIIETTNPDFRISTDVKTLEKAFKETITW